jgi:hypothetical protein
MPGKEKIRFGNGFMRFQMTEIWLNCKKIMAWFFSMVGGGLRKPCERFLWLNALKMVIVTLA